jgi:hypothetical protein
MAMEDPELDRHGYWSTVALPCPDLAYVALPAAGGRLMMQHYATGTPNGNRGVQELTMGYTCGTCGVWHDERPMAFGARMPEIVSAMTEAERKARVELSSDQCILDGEHYFVLGNLDLPIRGTQELVRFTVWTTLSQANFERASELWTTEGRESEPPYFGWLSNPIPSYPQSISIKAAVHTEPVGIRPRIEIVDQEHPLGIDQRDGISPERADAIIHAAWHG